LFLHPDPSFGCFCLKVIQKNRTFRPAESLGPNFLRNTRHFDGFC